MAFDEEQEVWTERSHGQAPVLRGSFKDHWSMIMHAVLRLALVLAVYIYDSLRSYKV